MIGGVFLACFPNSILSDLLFCGVDHTWPGKPVFAGRRPAVWASRGFAAMAGPIFWVSYGLYGVGGCDVSGGCGAD